MLGNGVLVCVSDVDLVTAFLDRLKDGSESRSWFKYALQATKGGKMIDLQVSAHKSYFPSRSRIRTRRF
jgi:hypothetical protein